MEMPSEAKLKSGMFKVSDERLKHFFWVADQWSIVSKQHFPD